MMTICDLITALLADRGRDLASLALETGIDFTTTPLTTVSLEDACVIADALGVELPDLVPSRAVLR